MAGEREAPEGVSGWKSVNQYQIPHIYTDIETVITIKCVLTEYSLEAHLLSGRERANCGIRVFGAGKQRQGMPTHGYGERGC
jgi:hypothetical protein